jgi:hypothetical protein
MTTLKDRLIRIKDLIKKTYDHKGLFNEEYIRVVSNLDMQVNKLINTLEKKKIDLSYAPEKYYNKYDKNTDLFDALLDIKIEYKKIGREFGEFHQMGLDLLLGCEPDVYKMKEDIFDLVDCSFCDALDEIYESSLVKLCEYEGKDSTKDLNRFNEVRRNRTGEIIR